MHDDVSETCVGTEEEWTRKYADKNVEMDGETKENIVIRRGKM